MNYKYQVLQGVKNLGESDYNSIDCMEEFTSLRNADKCFNKLKATGEDGALNRRFEQITQLVKVFLDEDGDQDYDVPEEVIKEEEWKFCGNKGRRV